MWVHVLVHHALRNTGEDKIFSHGVTSANQYESTQDFCIDFMCTYSSSPSPPSLPPPSPPLPPSLFDATLSYHWLLGRV